MARSAYYTRLALMLGPAAAPKEPRQSAYGRPDHGPHDAQSMTSLVQHPSKLWVLGIGGVSLHEEG